MQLVTAFLLSFIFFTFWFGNLNTLASGEDIFVSEINFRGSVSDSRCINQEFLKDYEISTNWCGKDEWLELFNPTSETIELSAYSVELRGGNILNLAGTIESGEYLVVGFTQKNFASVIESDLSSYQLLYMSSESDKNTGNHNLTFILRNGQEIIDQMIVHPESFAENYLELRGYSFERQSQNSDWVKSTNEFLENNFGTPGFGGQLLSNPEPVEIVEPKVVTVIVPDKNLQPSPEKAYTTTEKIPIAETPATNVAMEKVIQDRFEISLETESLSKENLRLEDTQELSQSNKVLNSVASLQKLNQSYIQIKTPFLKPIVYQKPISNDSFEKDNKISFSSNYNNFNFNSNESELFEVKFSNSTRIQRIQSIPLNKVNSCIIP